MALSPTGAGVTSNRPSVMARLSLAVLVVGATAWLSAGPSSAATVAALDAYTAVPNTGLAPGGIWTISNTPSIVRHVTGTPVLTISGNSATWVAVCWGANPTSGSECNWEGVRDTVDGGWIGACGDTPAAAFPCGWVPDPLNPTVASTQLKLWPYDCTQGSDIGGLFSGAGEQVWIGWVAQGTVAPVDPATLPLIQKQLLQYDCGAVPPTVTGISPSSGPTTGGTALTITGTELTDATKVLFGGIVAPSFTVDSASSITAVSPAPDPGWGCSPQCTVPVRVVFSDGSYLDTLQFTFVENIPPPTVTGISPSSGWAVGGSTVTITGTNFTGATAVLFGGVAAPSFTVVNATSMTAVSPASTTGRVDVRVVTPAGASAISRQDRFAFFKFVSRAVGRRKFH